MVLPTTGPFQSTVSTVSEQPNPYGHRPVVRQVTKYSHRQKRPYTIPLEWWVADKNQTHYRNYCGETGWFDPAGPGVGSAPAWIYPGDNVYNQAYSRFKAKCGDAASWAVTLAERRQAMQMMTKRIIMLAKFTQALRKGDFEKARRALNCGYPPGWSDKDGSRRGTAKREAKHFANNYLEFHFGWSPLISDIYKSAKTLSDGIPLQRVEGKAKKVTTKTTDLYHLDTVNRVRREGSLVLTTTEEVTLRAWVQVENPNLHLAAQLGLINPATVAFELVPFSFVLDWFVNVQDFLNSFTDFAGLSFIWPHRTDFVMQTSAQRQKDVFNYDRPYTGTTTGMYTFETSRDLTLLYAWRKPGPFAGPSLRIRDPWIVSPRRGLAAISLLIQAMK